MCFTIAILNGYTGGELGGSCTLFDNLSNGNNVSECRERWFHDIPQHPFLKFGILTMLKRIVKADYNKHEVNQRTCDGVASADGGGLLSCSSPSDSSKSAPAAVLNEPSVSSP